MAVLKISKTTRLSIGTLEMFYVIIENGHAFMGKSNDS